MANQTDTIAFWVLLVGTCMMLLLASAVIFFIYRYQRKLIKRRLAFQEIENMLRQQELKSAYALLEGQDMERQRIAEELHDSLGSTLVTLSMFTDAFQKAASEEERHGLAIKIGSTAQQAVYETRNISHKLDIGALRHFGLKAGLEDLVNTLHQSGIIQVFTSIELGVGLSNDISVNLYRIVQELINNTLKHAKAAEIRIDVSQIQDDYLSLIYQDDGIGLPANSSLAKGMGLRNITSRVEKLQGTISFSNHSTKGVSVIIEIPLS